MMNTVLVNTGLLVCYLLELPNNRDSRLVRSAAGIALLHCQMSNIATWVFLGGKPIALASHL